MSHTLTANELILSREHNIYAAMLSVIPGLGHIYKGHYAAGFAIMLLGPPLAIWAGVLLSLATLGLGMLLPLFCWAWVAFDAYYEVDLRHHRHSIE
jgi:hypothetical protein